MVKTKLILMAILFTLFCSTACGKNDTEVVDMVPETKKTDVTECMSNSIELTNKGVIGEENTYVLTMPDYKQILEDFDNSDDIEQYIVSSLNNDYPVVSIEIQALKGKDYDLSSPEVKEIIEDEFTKAINVLLEKESKK